MENTEDWNEGLEIRSFLWPVLFCLSDYIFSLFSFLSLYSMYNVSLKKDRPRFHSDNFINLAR